VKVKAWTDTVAVIDELDPSSLVALIDPTKASRGTPASGARPPTGGAGVAP
jgi:hypothetical protein